MSNGGCHAVVWRLRFWLSGENQRRSEGHRLSAEIQSDGALGPAEPQPKI